MRGQYKPLRTDVAWARPDHRHDQDAVNVEIGTADAQGLDVEQRGYVPTLIAHISDAITLQPDDVIMTGTPAGYGPIKPGDDIEIEISAEE
jgi:hypothetical protein